MKTKGRWGMPSVAMNGHKKMDKAIDQLNKAVQDKKDEIAENLEELKKNAQRTLDNTKENIVETASQVDKNVRKNAWAYIGGAALCAVVVGFITGRLTKK